MPDLSRIDDLRRRVQKDPASIAFAQLAEELRRAGQMEEAVETCRAGLALHPSYLSARVTLGRALVELNQLDPAAEELGLVLKSAPENLAAMRAMAEIHHRRGHLPQALAQFRAALTIARNDPDLEETVADLARKVEPKRPNVSPDHLSQSEFLKHLPTAPVRSAPAVAVPAVAEPPPVGEPQPAPVVVPTSVAAPIIVPTTAAAVEPAAAVALTPNDSHDPIDAIQRDRASRTLVALERLLDAIHGTRTHIRP